MIDTVGERIADSAVVAACYGPLGKIIIAVVHVHDLGNHSVCFSGAGVIACFSNIMIYNEHNRTRHASQRCGSCWTF